MECPPEFNIKEYSSPTVVEDHDSVQSRKDQDDDAEEVLHDTKGTKSTETFHNASPDKDTLKEQPVTA